MIARVQLKKKVSGRESRGAWRQDELIGGKSTVVKYVDVDFDFDFDFDFDLIGAQLAVGLWREDFTCAVVQWLFGVCSSVRLL
jgi:hypothetical protein